MKKTLKRILLPIFYLFVDKGSYLSFDKTKGFFSLMMYSIRFKLAAKGIYLTSNERKFAAIRNMHKGKRCFIIGNGPSLNNIDLTKLVDEYTFGVNAIYLNKENMGFDPTYYVVEDYLVAEDRAPEINKYNGPKLKFFGSYLDYCLSKDDKTITTNVMVDYGDNDYLPFFSKNPLRKLGVGGSVTFICLQLAYYMGFDEVYMIGFDHNYKIEKSVDKNADILTSTEDDVNHFNPAYFGKGYRWHDPKVDRMEMGFKAAKAAFEQSGRKIINATYGGHLEVFPRVAFSDIFQNQDVKAV